MHGLEEGDNSKGPFQIKLPGQIASDATLRLREQKTAS